MAFKRRNTYGTWNTSYPGRHDLYQTIVLSNGDTEEWVKLEFNAFGDGEIIKTILMHAIAGDGKIFDFKRKCWFVRAEHIDILLAGLREIMKHGRSLDGWTIKDDRVKIESFEEFFEDTPAVSSPAKSKETLLQLFTTLCFPIDKTVASISVKPTVLELKPIYRKSAMFYHPDRNNGDGTKMSELNQVWSELQQYL